MHPVLPLYSVFLALALLGLRMSRPEDRTMVWLSAWGAMSVVLVAATFREIKGDTWRYYIVFAQMSDLSFAQMWELTDNNWLFAVTNWLLAQLGTHPLWLFLPVTLFCIVLTRYSLRQLLGPTSTAVAIILYSAYPFFVFYIANGIKQGIAMVLLFQGYVTLYRLGLKRSVVWFLLAPMFHTGATLVFPCIILHWLFWRSQFGYRRALSLSFGIMIICVILSAIGYNKDAMSFLESYAQFSRSYEVYFMEASEFGYKAGFRLDFTIFSLLPFALAAWLRTQGRGLSYQLSGWWINLYTLLACLYHLFSFAPFADRFAGFGWYLIPAILVIMLVDCGSQQARRKVVAAFAVLNVLIFQFYTGYSIRVEF